MVKEAGSVLNYGFNRQSGTDSNYLGGPVEYDLAFNRLPDICCVTSYVDYNIEEVTDKILNSELYKDCNCYVKEMYKYLHTNKYKVLDEIYFFNYTKKILFVVKLDTFYNDDTESGGYEYPRDTDDETTLNNEIAVLEKEALPSGKVEFFCQSVDKDKTFELFETFKGLSKTETKKKRELNIVIRGEYGFSLKAFSTTKLEINIDNNYNDDLKPVYEKILEKLNTDGEKGIVLFTGDPGTGKTTLLRRLTQDIVEKKLIYVPPDMASFISSPEMVAFLLKHPNSILFIEDAENTLKSRKSGGTQAVSNLLNLSDGLLGDVLKLQIVCTFNCSVDEIDIALRRKGRLIGEYKFNALTVEKSNLLLEQLFPGKGYKTDKELTIAEIYTYEEKEFKINNTNSSIGFRRN